MAKMIQDALDSEQRLHSLKPVYVLQANRGKTEVFLLNRDSGNEFFRGPNTPLQREFLRKKQAEKNTRAFFDKMEGLI